MLQITARSRIRADELQIEFVRSSGPGGQNVNKVATAAQLRFDVLGSPSLPEAVKHRLVKLAGSRLTAEGILILEAHRFRTQEANRQDALQRFAGLLLRAEQEPKHRRPTRPTAASKEARLEEKKRRSAVKKNRRKDVEG